MKKIVFLPLIALLFSTCSDEMKSWEKVYKIYAGEMVERKDLAGTYYEYEIKEPALTKNVFDNGILQAFLYYKKDGKDALCPLPFSDFLVDQYGYQWEEQFTVEFQVGAIKFIQKISDHSAELPIADYYDVLVRFWW